MNAAHQTLGGNIIIAATCKLCLITYHNIPVLYRLGLVQYECGQFQRVREGFKSFSDCLKQEATHCHRRRLVAAH